MTESTTANQLLTLLRSRVPLIVIESRDEAHVLAALCQLAVQLAQPVHTPVFKWSITDGLARLDVDLGGAQRHNTEPAELLKHVRAVDKPGIYALLDFHPYLADPMHVRLIKDICLGYAKAARTLVLISHEVAIPRELEHLSARFQLAYPSREERHAIVEATAREWQQLHGQRVKTDARALEMLVDNLHGMALTDVGRLARGAIFNDGAISRQDLPELMQAKYQLLNRHGVLRYEYDTADFAQVGGMQRLKQWLQQRRSVFNGTSTLPPPKGMLLLGVQGCGKSLCARAAAGVLGVPLLRFDPAALYNKYTGESERNLRETLHTAELMAPCVLWIDEIEKGMSSSDADGGTSLRVLGTFLTWLAEQRQRVFVVATANDVSALPPELLRKGRFDEIFFVDLPTPTIRADILRIHAHKQGLELADEHAQGLAQQADGFSGAELEQAVIAATYSAQSAGEPLHSKHIQQEINATRPLSVVMQEQVQALRAWAVERTVSAE